MTEEKAQITHKKLPTWISISAFILLAGFLILMAMGLKMVQSDPIKIGQTVPGFELTTFDQKSIQTVDLHNKVIVLNFWASWCKPCEQEAAELEQVWQQYKPAGEVIFLGVDYVDTEPEALRYLKQFGVTYPNGPDLRTTISHLFRIRGVPETYIIDRTGKLVFIKIGPFSSTDEIRLAIDPLLK
ncbi:MAG TPA: TlpA disulfide reductase family protein [Leptolinea sp.]